MPAGAGSPPPHRLVIVLGMHRSGTSLCANMLHALGVNMADAAGASPANQRGHWERPRINDLHDSVLAMFGRPWNEATHHLALPEAWWTDPRLDPVRRQLVDFLAPRVTGGAAFGFKDPRASRLLELWPPVLEAIGAEPLYVFCIRDPAQVARSVSARDNFPPDRAAYRWLIYNAHAVHGVGTARLCVIPYESWFSAPADTLARLATFIGAPPPPPALLAIVDAGLRHDTPTQPTEIPPIATSLHRAIAATTERFKPALLTLADTILGCERAVAPFLRDAAILRSSLADQNRVIADLQALVTQLRAAAAKPARATAEPS